MYEQNARWNEYYRETDPKRRRRMLDELSMTEPDDGANRLRLALWEARHLDPKRPDVELDRFLFQFVNMMQIYRTARWFRKSAVKQTKQALDSMLAGTTAQYGEPGERALYWEIRSAAGRYFKTSEGSGYNRSAFGMVASGDEGKADRLSREVWEMTTGLARRTGMEDDLRIWSRAVTDAYTLFDGSAPLRLRAVEEKETGKRKS